MVLTTALAQHTCALCEYFDGGGLFRVELARASELVLAGDCHNPASGRFETKSNDTCPAFYPDTGSDAGFTPEAAR